MKWAVFKDFRGVLYCEPVNEGLQIWERHRPGNPEARDLLGRVRVPAQPDSWEFKTVFLPSHYSRSDYQACAFELPNGSFNVSKDRAYLQENFWGMVKVLRYFSDDKVARWLQYHLRRLAPDGSMWISKRVKAAPPHPMTDRILELILEY